MIWRNTSILILFFLFSSSTCEREVELTLPEPPKRLVIYSTFSDNQKVRVQLSSSRFVLEEAQGEYLPGALMEIFHGEQFLEKLELQIPGDRETPFYSTINFIPIVGEKYTVKAFLDGFDPVQAESSIPVSNKLSSFDIQDLIVTTTENRKVYKYKLNLKIDDPEEEKNYYHLKISQQFFVKLIGSDIENAEIVSYSFSTDFDANDILANTSGGLLLEDDALRGNSTFSLEHTINPDIERIGKVFVELRTVSRDYYLFHSSVTRQRKNPGGLLTEPVFIYNNVENGHGVFAGYSTYMDSLSVID